MTIALSTLIAVIGLLLYMISGSPKWMEVGRIAFFCGLLVLLYQSGSLNILKK